MRMIYILIALSFIISFITSKGIHVEGSKLLDAEGKEFIFRGVNLAHAWYRDKTEFSLNEISALGANSARIVLACGTKWDKTPYSEVENIINWCEKAGLICVLELHDFTGSNKASDINGDKKVDKLDASLILRQFYGYAIMLCLTVLQLMYTEVKNKRKL